MTRTELRPDTLAAAVKMIQNGIAPEKVVQFIYDHGYMNGSLDMGRLLTANVRSAAEAMAA